MRLIQTLAFFSLVAASFTGRAQSTRDKTQWTFEAKKISGNKYNVIAHVKLEKGWHVYAMKPGGDSTLIPVSISFDKNDKVKLIGGVKEKGKLISQDIKGIDGRVNMYMDKVDYIQEVELGKPATITGNYEYQICNEMMCLPPTNKKFTVTVK